VHSSPSGQRVSRKFKTQMMRLTRWRTISRIQFQKKNSCQLFESVITRHHQQSSKKIDCQMSHSQRKFLRFRTHLPSHNGLNIPSKCVSKSVSFSILELMKVWRWLKNLFQMSWQITKEVFRLAFEGCLVCLFGINYIFVIHQKSSRKMKDSDTFESSWGSSFISP
jgi:hypothetical protein